MQQECQASKPKGFILQEYVIGSLMFYLLLDYRKMDELSDFKILKKKSFNLIEICRDLSKGELRFIETS